jgi:hypothetical protein
LAAVSTSVCFLTHDFCHIRDAARRNNPTAFLVLVENPLPVLLAGLAGGMVGFASNMVIKVTSSITLKVGRRTYKGPAHPT